MPAETTSDRGAIDLDALPRAEFDRVVGRLFEQAPGFAARLWSARPFGSDESFIAEARRIARAMPEAAQIELVNAHPRLGASPATVSSASFVEQGYDRPASSPDGDAARELERLNEAYEARFGFRYCVFVAGRAPSELIPEFSAALGRDRHAELRRAIDAAVDIGADRLAKMVR